MRVLSAPITVRRVYRSAAAAVVAWAVTNVHAQAAPAESSGTGRFVALRAAAVLSARPTECGAFKTSVSPDVARSSRWEEVRALDERRRCVRLARGVTGVGVEPQNVLSWFELEVVAKANDPIGLAERALVARALLRSGEPVMAYAWFSALQAQSPVAAWHVFAVHDYAVSASRVGRFDVASNCYRRLTSLGAWLPSEMKTSVLIEAAAVALRSTPPRALDVLSFIASLEQETLAPEVRRVTLVLQTVANATLNPSAPITPLTNVSGSTGVQNALRLADEDTRFVAAFARYSETGLWPEEDSSGASAPSDSFSSPAYVALIDRLRAAR